MGIGICNKCIKKYYPRKKTNTVIGWASARCAKCNSFPVKGYYGLEIKSFEKEYKTYINWLKIHRKTQGKRKGVK